MRGGIPCSSSRKGCRFSSYLPTARLACTLTLCWIIELMPLFWLAIMIPAADCPTLVMVLAMLKEPALTELLPPAPPVPP